MVSYTLYINIELLKTLNALHMHLIEYCLILSMPYDEHFDFLSKVGAEEC